MKTEEIIQRLRDDGYVVDLSVAESVFVRSRLDYGSSTFVTQQSPHYPADYESNQDGDDYS